MWSARGRKHIWMLTLADSKWGESCGNKVFRWISVDWIQRQRHWKRLHTHTNRREIKFKEKTSTKVNERPQNGGKHYNKMCVFILPAKNKLVMFSLLVTTAHKRIYKMRYQIHTYGGSFLFSLQPMCTSLFFRITFSPFSCSVVDFRCKCKCVNDVYNMTQISAHVRRIKPQKLITQSKKSTPVLFFFLSFAAMAVNEEKMQTFPVRTEKVTYWHSKSNRTQIRNQIHKNMTNPNTNPTKQMFDVSKKAPIYLHTMAAGRYGMEKNVPCAGFMKRKEHKFLWDSSAALVW